MKPNRLNALDVPTLGFFMEATVKIVIGALAVSAVLGVIFAVLSLFLILAGVGQ